jgi:hypothetical protein
MGSTPVECTTFKALKHNGLQRKERPKKSLKLLGNNCRFLSFFGIFSVFIGNLLATLFLDVMPVFPEC